MDDPFSDPFFANPFSQFGERREVEIKSDPVALEVKPLPTGAPPGFSGAIGNFTMTTDAKPKSVQVGDPITVTSTITGRGNFDRVGAPVIEDERGWHKYPPSSKFAKDDEVGISGTKTFETVLSPNEKKQSLPVMEFAYFDPVKEQYATLRSDPIAINVEGGAVAAASPVAVPPGSTPSGYSNKAGYRCKAAGYLVSVDGAAQSGAVFHATLRAADFLVGAVDSAIGVAWVDRLENSASQNR